MALVGYARCSTTHQDTQAQIDALLAAGVSQAQLFSEYISGAAPFAERVQLQAAIAACQPGDVLVVAKLDRLGRSMQDCVSRAAELLESGIHIRSLDGRVDTLPLGKMAKFVIGILAAAAEIERDLILERTEAGRQRALTAGVKFGRKRSWKAEQAAHVQELVASGLSHRQVAAKTGLSASTVRRMLQEVRK
jgi:DNA invertase Pin-like site-specific DNA recombinase